MKCPICDCPSPFYARHPEADLYRCQKCGHRFSVLSSQDCVESYGRDYFEQSHRNWFNHPNHELFRKIGKFIAADPTVRSVMDVGCGQGALLRYLKGCNRKQFTLTGIDLASNLPEVDIDFVVGDVITIPLHRRFDVVVSLAVIEHIADVHAFAGRLHDLCGSGGRLIVMTLNDGSVLYGVARALRYLGFTLPFNRLYSRHHVHHFTRHSLTRLLERHGFSIEKVILHNAPLAAIDIPISSRVVGRVLRLAIAAIFAAGRLVGRTYLQTVVCRRIDNPPVAPGAVKNDERVMMPDMSNSTATSCLGDVCSR
jgi:2-polyprenyl-3-methyl-5-hydroxy-6-metoxy-1,4-benzoquinol methylase